MAQINPPIKRSTELAPLSHEHHEGLLFAWKIKQGLQKEISPQRIGAFVEWFWISELAPHFSKEENVLLPVLGKKMSLKEQLLDEHAAIRKLLQEATEAPTPGLLQKLVQAVDDHIRFEERVLFKHIEVSATEEQLKEIGAQLAEDSEEKAVWDDVFWTR
jgi:hemerythrin-like domain-containing protein